MEFSLRIRLWVTGLVRRLRNIFNSRVFLDYAAGVPEGTGFWKLVPFFDRMKIDHSHYSNPESIHASGVEAKKAVEKARTQVAKFFAVTSSQILFTRGGTESCSVCIQGIILKWKKLHPGSTPKVITSSIEHSAVYETLRTLEERGEIELILLPVLPSGVTDISLLQNLLSKDVALVTCMLVNNELGTIQPVRDIGRIIKAYKKEHGGEYPLFHMDVIQASPYFDCAPSHYYADAVSIGGSKLGIRSSIGVLAVLNSSILEPVVLGGRQEKGLFPGSLNSKIIIKLGLTLDAISKNREKYNEKIVGLREYMKKLLKNTSAFVFDTKNSQSPHILTIWIPGISGEEAVLRLDARGISCSPQAACSDPARDSRIVRQVMKAQGMKESELIGQIRFSFGIETTKCDVWRAVRVLKKIL